jgi:uncharacterized membrane protein YfcA
MDWIIYIVLGSVAGFLAGLLGIGGGLVMSPVLLWLLLSKDVAQTIAIKMAIGTSLAAIIPSAMASGYAHNKREAVVWSKIKQFWLVLALGTFIGAFVAHELKSALLQTFLGSFALFAAWRLISKKQISNLSISVGLQKLLTAMIGLLSGIFGIGGGTFMVPFLNALKIDFHKAIGTSAALGFIIAVTGTLGYIYFGLQEPNLPPLSLGYVFVEALPGMAVGSVVMTQFGVRCAHALPVKLLKQIFALVLVVIGVKLLITAY